MFCLDRKWVLQATSGADFQLFPQALRVTRQWGYNSLIVFVSPVFWLTRSSGFCNTCCFQRKSVTGSAVLSSNENILHYYSITEDKKIQKKSYDRHKGHMIYILFQLIQLYFNFLHTKKHLQNRFEHYPFYEHHFSGPIVCNDCLDFEMTWSSWSN